MEPMNLQSFVNEAYLRMFSYFLQNYGIELKLVEIEDLIYLLKNIVWESDRLDIK
jgi:hypothetical protein